MRYGSIRRLAAAFCALAMLSICFVSAKADGHTLTVVDGGTGAAGSGSYAAGTNVAVSAGTKDGQFFSHWEAAGIALTDIYAPSVTIAMPANDVTLRAVFTPETPVKIAGVTIAGWTYGDTASEPNTAGISITENKTGGVTVAAPLTLVYTYAGTTLAGATYAASATAPTQAGSYTLVVSVHPDDATYSGVSMPIAFSIAPRTLHVSGITAVNRAYDGTTQVTLDASGVTFAAGDWKESGDPALAASNLVGTVADRHAADAKEVTVGGLALDPANPNYKLEFSGSVTVNITPAAWGASDLTWAGTDSRAFDGAASNVTASLRKLNSGDNVTVTVTGGTESAVGTHTATVTTLTGDDAGDYAAVPTPSTFTHSYEITPASLSFSVATNGTSGVTKSGDTLTATVTSSIGSGVTYAYQWKRNGTAIGGATLAAYVVTDADKGQDISVAVTASGSYTGTAESAPVRIVGPALSGDIAITGANALGATLTATPTLGSATAADYTLQWYSAGAVVSGATGTTYIIRESDLGQTITVRATAVSGASARFTGYVTSSAGYNVSPQSPAAPVIDVATKTSQITVSWNAPNARGSAITSYKLTITPSGGTSSTFTIDPSARSYTVTNLNAATTYTVVLTAVNAYGSTNSAAASVLVRAAYTGATPAAPTRKSRTTTSITLTPHTGYEYSIDGSHFQDSNVFKSLKAGKSYTFYQRVKATSTREASPISPKYTTYTLEETDDDDDDTATDTTTDTSDDDDTTTTGSTDSTVLYELVLPESNTNVLFSTMTKLINGNKQKAVTIRLTNLTYTFAQNTMQAESGRVWYDFGAAMNNCVHQNAIKALAGDRHVMTVHFNYGGTLPAEATIRIYVGAQYAGQTLYYYKYDETAGSLTLVQQTTLDSTGWATVTQSSCSDYVFTSGDITQPAVTPTPTPAASVSPSPTSDVAMAPPDKTGTGPNWMLIGIIAAAAFLFIAAIWLWLKKSDDESGDLE